MQLRDAPCLLRWNAVQSRAWVFGADLKGCLERFSQTARWFVSVLCGLCVVLPLTAPVAAHSASTDDAIAAVVHIYSDTAAAGSDTGKLSALLATSVDLEALASKVLGQAWNNATPAEQTDFKAVLRDVIARKLSTEFRADARFQITGARKTGAADIVVFSRLTRPDGHQDFLDWKMRPCAQKYCIFDLVRNNASFSVSRRDDYAPRLAALGGSVAALTRSLRSEIGPTQ